MGAKAIGRNLQFILGSDFERMKIWRKQRSATAGRELRRSSLAAPRPEVTVVEVGHKDPRFQQPARSSAFLRRFFG